TNQPITNQPITNQPITNQPITNQPITNQPITNQPITNQPITNQPITNQPITNQPTSATNKPVIHTSIDKQNKNNLNPVKYVDTNVLNENKDSKKTKKYYSTSELNTKMYQLDDMHTLHNVHNSNKSNFHTINNKYSSESDSFSNNNKGSMSNKNNTINTSDKKNAVRGSDKKIFVRCSDKESVVQSNNKENTINSSSSSSSSSSNKNCLNSAIKPIKKNTNTIADSEKKKSNTSTHKMYDKEKLYKDNKFLNDIKKSTKENNLESDSDEEFFEELSKECLSYMLSFMKTRIKKKNNKTPIYKDNTKNKMLKTMRNEFIDILVKIAMKSNTKNGNHNHVKSTNTNQKTKKKNKIINEDMEKSKKHVNMPGYKTNELKNTTFESVNKDIIKKKNDQSNNDKQDIDKNKVKDAKNRNNDHFNIKYKFNDTISSNKSNVINNTTKDEYKYNHANIINMDIQDHLDILNNKKYNSIVLCSNLRRAMITCLISFNDRLNENNEMVHIFTSLKEMEKHVDSITTCKIEKQIKSLDIDQYIDRDINDINNIFEFHKQKKKKNRFENILSYIFNNENDIFIIFGHSIWFQEFFKKFLPSPHIAKEVRIKNTGIIVFNIDKYIKNNKDVYEIDKDTIRVIYKGLEENNDKFEYTSSKRSHKKCLTKRADQGEKRTGQSEGTIGRRRSMVQTEETDRKDRQKGHTERTDRKNKQKEQTERTDRRDIQKEQTERTDRRDIQQEQTNDINGREWHKGER
ncbi:hypothetical protein HEP_00461400, partial [Hepatocystis sp. ex Piliocolobus tephrosceles]